MNKNNNESRNQNESELIGSLNEINGVEPFNKQNPEQIEFFKNFE